jgi:hypothetical protein
LLLIRLLILILLLVLLVLHALPSRQPAHAPRPR